MTDAERILQEVADIRLAEIQALQRRITNLRRMLELVVDTYETTIDPFDRDSIKGFLADEGFDHD